MDRWRIHRGMRRAAGSLWLATAVSMVVLACGAAGSTGTPAATATARPSTSEGPLETGGEATEPGPGVSNGSGGIVVDPGLLAVLPAAIDGVPVEPSIEAAGAMITDAGLGRSASAVAVGVVASVGDSEGERFAVVNVVQLRPGIYTEPFFATWRSDYDLAACEPAGGVERVERRTIGTRTVDVAHCIQGVMTYHLHIDGDIIVSLTTVGDERLGERVLAAVRE